MEETNITIEKARPDELAKNWAITIFIIIGIVAIGLIAFNQFIDWKYKGAFLAGPCQLCVQLNPEVGSCWEMKNNLENYVYNYENRNYTELFKKINNNS